MTRSLILMAVFWVAVALTAYTSLVAPNALVYWLAFGAGLGAFLLTIRLSARGK